MRRRRWIYLHLENLSELWHIVGLYRPIVLIQESNHHDDFFLLVDVVRFSIDSVSHYQQWFPIV